MSRRALVSAARREPAAARYRRNRHRYGAHELILREVPPGSSVLDVGCATGYLGEPLRERGCRVWGIDKDAAAVAVAAPWYEEVRALDLEACDHLPWPDAFFDVALCADVLEHLREPDRALRIVGRHIAPGGLLIVSVPNVAHVSVRVPLAFGRFAYRPSGILDETHVRLYTFGTARELVESSGYELRGIHGASDRFGALMHLLGPAAKVVRGLLAYNVVVFAVPSGT